MNQYDKLRQRVGLISPTQLHRDRDEKTYDYKGRNYEPYDPEEEERKRKEEEREAQRKEQEERYSQIMTKRQQDKLNIEKLESKVDAVKSIGKEQAETLQPPSPIDNIEFDDRYKSHRYRESAISRINKQFGEDLTNDIEQTVQYKRGLGMTDAQIQEQYIPIEDRPLDKLAEIEKKLKKGEEKGFYKVQEGFYQYEVMNVMSNEANKAMNGLPNRLDEVNRWIADHPELEMEESEFEAILAPGLINNPTGIKSRSLQEADNLMGDSTKPIQGFKLKEGVGVPIDSAVRFMGSMAQLGYASAKDAAKDPATWATLALMMATSGASSALLASKGATASKFINVPLVNKTAQLAKNLSTMQQFKYGMNVGRARYMMDLEAGSAYNEYIQSGVHPEIAKQIAKTVGVANGIIEYVQFGQLTKALPGVGTFAKATQKIAQDELRTGLMTMGKAWGVDIAQNVGEEMLQESNTTLGLALSQYMMEAPNPNTVDGLKVLAKTMGSKEYQERMAETAVQTAMNVWLMPLASSAGSFAANRTITKLEQSAAKKAAYGWYTQEEMATKAYQDEAKKVLPYTVEILAKDAVESKSETSVSSLTAVVTILEEVEKRPDLSNEDKAIISDTKQKANEAIAKVEFDVKSENPDVPIEATNAMEVEQKILNGELPRINPELSDVRIEYRQKAKDKGIFDTIKNGLLEGKRKSEISEEVEKLLPRKERNAIEIMQYINAVEIVEQEIRTQLNAAKVANLMSVKDSLKNKAPEQPTTNETEVSQPTDSLDEENATTDAVEPEKGNDTVTPIPKEPLEVNEGKFEPTDAVKVPTKDIQLDPKRFQFRFNGTTNRMEGIAWNDKLAGTILLWESEYGDLYVVNGHHRVMAAKDNNVQTLDAKILRGITAEQARAEGAILNIAEGSADAIDTAKFLRDTNSTLEDLTKLGVPPKSKIARDGANLAKLEDGLFYMTATKQIPYERAVMIGRELEDKVAQRQFYDMMVKEEAKRGYLKDSTIDAMLNQVKAVGAVEYFQESLLGADDTRSAVVERAELVGYVKDNLKNKKSVLKKITKTKNTRMLEQLGNKIKVDDNVKEMELADQALYLLDKTVNAKDSKVSQMFNDLAIEYAKTGDKKVLDKALKMVGDLMESGELLQEAFGKDKAKTELLDTLEEQLDGQADLFGQLAQLKNEPAIKVRVKHGTDTETHAKLMPLIEIMEKNPIFNGLEIVFTGQASDKFMDRSELDAKGYRNAPEGRYITYGWYESGANSLSERDNAQRTDQGDSTRDQLRDNGNTPKKSTRGRISLNNSAQVDTLLHEAIHSIQDILYRIDPEFEVLVKDWEKQVNEIAREQGIVLPQGREMLTHALMLGEFGYANDNPALAKAVEVPTEIVDQFKAMLGKQFVKEAMGDNKADPARAIKAEYKKLADVNLQNTEVAESIARARQRRLNKIKMDLKDKQPIRYYSPDTTTYAIAIPKDTDYEVSFFNEQGLLTKAVLDINKLAKKLSDMKMYYNPGEISYQLKQFNRDQIDDVVMGKAIDNPSEIVRAFENARIGNILSSDLQSFKESLNEADRAMVSEAIKEAQSKGLDKPNKEVTIEQYKARFYPEGTDKDIQAEYEDFRDNVETFRSDYSTEFTGEPKFNISYQVKKADIDTEEFKQWFKDSKVVDENGNPLIVYHGSLWKFDTFRGNMIFFSTTADFAERYAESKAFASGNDNDKQIYEAYLSVQNIFDYRNEEHLAILEAALEDEVNIGFNNKAFTKAELIDRIRGDQDLAPYWTPEQIENAKYAKGIGDARDGYNNDLFVADRDGYVYYGWVRDQEALRLLTDDMREELINNGEITIKTRTANGTLMLEEDYKKLNKADIWADDYISKTQKIRVNKTPKQTTILSNQDNWQYFELSFGRESREDIVSVIKRLGFDGIIMQEDNAINYAVFNPTQIKSVYNNGQFSLYDPNINYQLKSSEDGITQYSLGNINNFVEAEENKSVVYSDTVDLFNNKVMSVKGDISDRLMPFIKYDAVMGGYDAIKLNDGEPVLITREEILEVMEKGQPLFQIKELVAVHNLNEGQLKSTVKLGGIVMPSIAVTLKDYLHDRYGEISLLFNKNTIDPRANKDNRVYSGDAYTPEFPSIKYKINDKEAQTLRNRVKSALAGTQYMNEYRDTIDPTNIEDQVNRSGSFDSAYKYDPLLMLTYLKEKGIEFEPVMRTKNYEFDVPLMEQLQAIEGEYINKKYLESSEIEQLEPVFRETINKFYGVDLYKEEIGYGRMDRIHSNIIEFSKDATRETIDGRATETKLQETIDHADYTKWFNDVSKDIIEAEGIRNNRDLFTNSGNRRSWNALHDPVTLDNLLRAMKSESETASGMFGGVGRFGAAVSKKFTSIADIREAADRLTTMDIDTYNAMREDFNERLIAVASRIKNIRASNQFMAIDNAFEAMVDAFSNGKSRAGITKILNSYTELNITDDAIDEMMQLADEVAQMPTEYFEAKPRRIVGLEEIQAVIMPLDTDPELIQMLKDRGIHFIEFYDKAIEGDRQRAMDEVLGKNDVSFQIKPTDTNTEAFRKWFKDSKVVDENGMPLVVYHGTQQGGFNTFITENFAGYGGAYFTPDQEVADSFSNGGSTYPVYVSLQNPFIVDAGNMMYDNIARPIEMGEGRSVDTQEIVAFARDNGYDGVIVKNVIEGTRGLTDDVIAFNPTQIKSVYNRGTWDATDINMYYQIKGEPQMEERSWSQTVRDANLTSEWLRDMLTDRKMMYEVAHNEDSMIAGAKLIDERGIEYIEARLDNDFEATPDVMAAGMILIYYYQESGDKPSAYEMTAKVAKKATTAGQAIQILSYLNRESPEGMLRFVRREYDKASTSRQRKMLDELTQKAEEAMKEVNSEAVDTLDLEGLVKKVQDMTQEELDTIEIAQDDKKTKDFMEGKGVETTPKTTIDPSVIIQAIKDHYKGDGKRSLISLFRKAGLNATEARLLSDSVEAEMLKATDAKIQKVIDRLVPGKAQAVDKSIKTLISQGRYGEALKLRIGQKKNIPVLTQEMSDMVYERATEISKMPAGREKDIELGKLIRDIDATMPIPLASKITTFRVMMMLLNPVTMIRNIIGNFGFGAVDTFALNVIGSQIDKMYAQNTGMRTTLNRRLDVVKKQYQGYGTGFGIGYEDAKLGIDTSRDLNKMELGRTGRAFARGTVLGELETWLNIGLRATDKAALMATYIDTIAEQMEIAGVAEPTQEMIDIAEQLGLYRTFNDDTLMSAAFGGAKQALNNIGTEGLNRLQGRSSRRGGFGMGDVLMPFTKTVANLVARSIDYSPAGLILTMSKLYLDHSTSDYVRQRMKVEAWSRAITGSTMIATGMILAKLGILRGSDDEDEDRDILELQEQAGLRPFTINLSAIARLLRNEENSGDLRAGDQLATYDWYQPSALTIAIGADAVSGSGETFNLLNSIVRAMEVGTETVTNQPLVQNITRFFAYGVNKGFTNMLKQLPASFVPSVLGRVAQAADGGATDPYSYYSEGRQAWNLIANKLVGDLEINGVPLGRGAIPDRIDIMGNPIEWYGTDMNFIKYLQALSSPAIFTDYKPTEEMQFLMDLTRKTQDTSIIQMPQKTFSKDGVSYEPTPEQFEAMSIYYGKALQQEINSLMKYGKGRDDEWLAKQVRDIVSDIKGEIKFKFIRGDFN